MGDARLAVDIGGTFTDAVVERADGSRVSAKTLTTPSAPEEGFLAAAAEALARAHLEPADIAAIIHGTTLATNALIERRGARTALLTTAGHRDSLEMAYENRFEQYDVDIDRPAPLVPRWLRLPVVERMNAQGRPLLALDAGSVEAHLPTLDAQGVESLAIGFLHAYANPAHERAAADIVARARPHLSLTLSSDVAPEIREYERLSTAVANAYVRPLMERYLGRLRSALAARGFRADVLLMTSGGGLATLEAAARFPIRLVESGPAGGAILAAAIARDLKLDRVISFDMGGTTAKLCLIDDGAPQTARAFEVDRSYRFKKGSGFPVRIPVVEMVEIGAGGGSIARVDALGRIAVGPESAGSEPGPAAYGRGGARATVTDADLVLGRIAPERFAGGAIPLDATAAARAIDASVAAAGFSGDAAAHAIAEIVDENMAAAARAHAIEWGKDLGGRTLIAFGGAAPLHAARLAEKIGVARVIVPPGAGVGSAIGFLLAPAAYEVVRSRPMRLDAFDAAALAALFAQMRAEAEAVVRAAVGSAPLAETRAAHMRYVGQGHEIAVPLDGVASQSETIEREALAAAFAREYARLYGRTIPGMEIEALTFSLALTGPEPRRPAPPPAPQSRDREAEARRAAFDARLGRRVDVALFERARLEPGDRVAGPALIIEDQTTAVIGSGFTGRIDAAGNIVMERTNL